MKILICSVHFGPGHTAHLDAYKHLLDECGFENALYLAPAYLKLFSDENIKKHIIISLEDALRFNPDVVWLYNIGFEDRKFIRAFKRRSKLIYVLHEPYMGIHEILKEGKNIPYMVVAALLNAWICSQSYRVVLSSAYAVANCKKYMLGTYQKSLTFPLIFPDKYISTLNRQYFSMIGGYSDPHASDEFLNFVKASYQKNTIKFQIATRTDISEKLKDTILQEMVQDGRLLVHHGRPLTEDEMNQAYRRSFCTWNAYHRSTQSGVLANSFMQGTPVMATHLGSFDEYVQDGKNGVFIDDYSYDSIFNAFQRVKGNIDEMVENARNTFLTHFYYRNQEEKFKEIVGNLVR